MTTLSITKNFQTLEWMQQIGAHADLLAPGTAWGGGAGSIKLLHGWNAWDDVPLNPHCAALTDFT